MAQPAHCIESRNREPRNAEQSCKHSASHLEIISGAYGPVCPRRSGDPQRNVAKIQLSCSCAVPRGPLVCFSVFVVALAR